MSSEPLLVLDGVVKRFGGLTALDGVSFSVAPSEILGLVGPNGSGKTTAINVISGVYHADAGSVCLGGQRIDRLPAFRRVPLGVNRTFQVPKPFAAMTVRENIEVAAYFGARGRVDIDDVLVEIDLADQADVLASGLTVNQQKRLDLGRALATEPKLLLVDEIGAGLNPGELGVIADLLCRLAARGIALIVVEHLLDFLNRIANRVIVLSAGRMLYEGTLENASRNADVVAAFIGG
ncbi:MAG TPA: ABC transporter ATP-binding protein [Alphaproteobacteria bacterium]|nr:ABC transporter ATP-binding protein [Alphaproteobacteria bacterium]